MVAVVGEGEVARGLQRVIEPALEFGAELLEYHALDGVLMA
jgi:hypothetical protein